MSRCNPTERVEPGASYMTYQWWVGACNELTIGKLDMQSRTPEYKYCACRIERIANQERAEAQIGQMYESIRAQMGLKNYTKEQLNVHYHKEIK